MKKFIILLSVVLGTFVTDSILMSCSDDKPADNQDESGELPGGGDLEIGGIKIPAEVLQKVQAIYSKASIEPQEVTTVHQLAILTSVCAARQVEGPITVTAATLNNEDITLVTLGGTEEKEGQATSMKESQAAAFGKPNDYLKAVTKLFEDNTIPQEKPVLVTGISLGGMIAQQLLGVPSIMEHHKLKGIITFGSPITLPVDRKDVKVVRFADVHDKVPQLGESILRMGLITGDQMTKKELTQKLDELDAQEKVARTSQYTGMIETHALSYISDPCWNDVDFLGDVAKKNVLELKETMKFYPAPKSSEK